MQQRRVVEMKNEQAWNLKKKQVMNYLMKMSLQFSLFTTLSYLTSAIEDTVSFGGKRSVGQNAFYFAWNRNLEGREFLRTIKILNYLSE